MKKLFLLSLAVLFLFSISLAASAYVYYEDEVNAVGYTVINEEYETTQLWEAENLTNQGSVYRRSEVTIFGDAGEIGNPDWDGRNIMGSKVVDASGVTTLHEAEVVGGWVDNVDERQASAYLQKTIHNEGSIYIDKSFHSFNEWTGTEEEYITGEGYTEISKTAAWWNVADTHIDPPGEITMFGLQTDFSGDYAASGWNDVFNMVSPAVLVDQPGFEAAKSWAWAGNMDHDGVGFNSELVYFSSDEPFEFSERKDVGVYVPGYGMNYEGWFPLP